ncbi:TIGR02281 family clan AA aspartic protease [Marivita sp. XM-24bin2]|uniref:retropepsin-like aspartic protease family protein n=1 Tax=unclassified Marivita TaxID=2632480 RepID=UPI000D7ADA8C|nr:TIGR02281 family clan AA aspartic protease [Marivita sp. XM-24bin2]MCR9108092.1 TIGR02281 family clan AA aspartic protease [Paracoccaceae bacterium]PWL36025.1 MAG: TIGR02281 family clan AA aspartic protease [Marivita sp. XM-24bin2]
MSAMDYGNLAYLILLGAVIVFWFFVQNRQSLNKTLQQGAVWGLIFVGVIAAVGLWGDIRQTVQPQQLVMEDAGRIEVPRGPDGHYYLTLEINDAPVRFVVDTGATSMVLTQEDAKRVGLDEEDVIFYSEAMTANGLVRTAPVRLDDVALGPFHDRDVRAFVNEGEMSKSLLGMEYLNRFARLEINNGRLILER